MLLYFPRQPAWSSDPFPKGWRGNWERSTTEASTLKGACAFREFQNGDPGLPAVWHTIAVQYIWIDKWLSRALFCFHFCKLYDHRGETKLMPYACKNPSDISYCNRRWQWLSEQKEHAWVKVNAKHLLGNKAPPGDLCSCSASLGMATWNCLTAV